MFKKTFQNIKRFFAPNAYGLMVVNGSYFRPMANKGNNMINPGMSDEKYFEICSDIRRA